jgi:VanZ family protein
MTTNDIFNHAAKPRLWQIVLACYWLVLVVSTHVPPTFPGLPPHGTDRLAHLAAYGVLAGLVGLNLQLAGGHVTGRHFRWLWIAVVLFGVVDELTQPAFGRDASWIDWLADATGAVLGLMLFAWLRAWGRASSPAEQGPRHSSQRIDDISNEN